MKKIHLVSTVILCIQILSIFFSALSAQDNTDADSEKYLYRPRSVRLSDTLQMGEKRDTLVSINQDSIDARLKFVRDSINARMQFIRDSIAAREAFVKDSIQRRERKIDSLNFLRNALPGLLEASLKTISDEIIIKTVNPEITNNLTLTNYQYITLPFDFTRPYTPWKSVINLSNKPVAITTDANRKKILAIRSPVFHFTYEYNPRSKTLRIDEPGAIVSKTTGKFYKIPVDTVFYDARGRIIKIKRYHDFYQIKNSYQKGSFLFTHLIQVRQFDYDPSYAITQYQLTNFCDRSNAQEARKVCNVITYQVSRQGNKYLVVRKNDPPNPYSDGEFIYEFQGDYDLKNVAFTNLKKTENWKTYIELNDEGNVSVYIYENQGAIRNSLMINYYLNDPDAKYKVETISCAFEDDGVSYYQKNNMTGKSRSRDKMTLEWSPWR
jgi:hypothetical protein